MTCTDTAACIVTVLDGTSMTLICAGSSSCTLNCGNAVCLLGCNGFTGPCAKDTCICEP